MFMRECTDWATALRFLLRGIKWTNLGPSCPFAVTHHAEVVLCVLVAILSLDRVAVASSFTGKLDVSLVAAPRIAAL